MGSASVNSTLPGFEAIEKNEPYKHQAVLPMTFNSNWNEGYTQTFIYKFNGTPMNTVISSITFNTVIDAYGILKLPNLPELDALRIKEKTTINTNGVSKSFTRFIFISKEGAQASVTAVDENPSVSGVINIDGASYNEILVTGIKGNNEIIPTEFELSQNYPNPFNPSTTIKYQIPSNVKGETSNVKLIVYDVLGRKVLTLVNKEQSAGDYEVQFDASNLTSGVYYYRLQSSSPASGSGQIFVESRKMILLK